MPEDRAKRVQWLLTAAVPAEEAAFVQAAQAVPAAEVAVPVADQVEAAVQAVPEASADRGAPVGQNPAALPLGKQATTPLQRIRLRQRKSSINITHKMS